MEKTIYYDTKIIGFANSEKRENDMKMTVVRSMNENGLGTKIPSDFKVQTSLGKRVYEHRVATYHNAPRNFDYIVVKGDVYKVHFEDGKPVVLSKYSGYIGF